MCPHSLMEEEKMNHINGQCPKWSFQRRGLKFWFWFREQTCHIGPGSRSEYTERPREITTKQVSPTNEERTQGLTFRFHLLKLNRGNHRTSSFSGHLDRSPFRWTSCTKAYNVGIQWHNTYGRVQKVYLKKWCLTFLKHQAIFQPEFRWLCQLNN